MGVGGISIWQLLIILLIVLLLFGTKRLKNIGSDLGNAVRGFRGALSEAEKRDEEEEERKATEAAQQRSGEASAVGTPGTPDGDKARDQPEKPA